MVKQIIITVYNEEDFHNALGEIKSNLDYDNIEYDYEVKDLTDSKNNFKI